MIETLCVLALSGTCLGGETTDTTPNGPAIVKLTVEYLFFPPQLMIEALTYGAHVEVGVPVGKGYFGLDLLYQGFVAGSTAWPDHQIVVAPGLVGGILSNSRPAFYFEGAGYVGVRNRRECGCDDCTRVNEGTVWGRLTGGVGWFPLRRSSPRGLGFGLELSYTPPLFLEAGIALAWVSRRDRMAR